MVARSRPTGGGRWVISGGGMTSDRTVRTAQSGTTGRAVVRVLLGLGLLATTWIAGCTAVAGAGVTGSTWVQESPTTSPTDPYNSVVAYDAGTGQLLLVTCSDCESGVPLQTWSWTGTTWTLLHPVSSPASLVGESLAYDAGTGQMVLFGGLSQPPGQSLENQTWTWNGSDWTEQHPASSPPARDQAMMAYDTTSGQLLLFGGEVGSTSLDDTWSWNGSTWIQQQPASSPPVRNDASMAFDPATGQVVLFGGAYRSAGGSADRADTWTWNGSDWTEQFPTTVPADRYNAPMAYDPDVGILMFGGDSTGSGDAFTWIWDGTDWTAFSPTSGPPQPSFPTADYDADTDQLVYFGGSTAPSTPATWVFEPVGSFFLPYWQTPGVGCTGPTDPGLSVTGPAGCNSSGTGPGSLAYDYLAGPENGDGGSTFSTRLVVPPGYEDQLTYGIPPGGYLSNAAGSVTLDGIADGSTKGGAAFGRTCRRATTCVLWKSHQLTAGDHVLTVTSEADYVNFYGVWVTQKVHRSRT